VSQAHHPLLLALLREELENKLRLRILLHNSARLSESDVVAMLARVDELSRHRLQAQLEAHRELLQ
jgi:IS5 family transposase